MIPKIVQRNNEISIQKQRQKDYVKIDAKRNPKLNKETAKPWPIAFFEKTATPPKK